MQVHKTALITGATSGIGKAYAEAFARRGYGLILTGRRKHILDSVAADLKKNYGVPVETIIAELSDEKDLERVNRRVKAAKNLRALVNNAGFGSWKYFHEEDYQGQENMLKVHALAPVKLTYSALQHMIKAREGIIINVASLSARAFAPAVVMYSATKAFLTAFSETLHMEHMGDGIFVQALCPGFTHTDFHEKMGMKRSALRDHGILKWMSASKVVEISLKNLKRNKAICIPGFWNRVIWHLLAVPPRSLYYRLAAGARKMDELFPDSN